ncbi:hypothetical protein PSY31_22685, partial [Shigella flexneri]|nr:hypothetical protein [Shigella flexneri]
EAGKRSAVVVDQEVGKSSAPALLYALASNLLEIVPISTKTEYEHPCNVQDIEETTAQGYTEETDRMEAGVSQEDAGPVSPDTHKFSRHIIDY